MSKIDNRKMVNNINILSPSIVCFKNVYEQKSINGSARKMGHDPASISRTIAKLEENLNTQLFIRHKNGLKSTPLADSIYKSIIDAQNTFSLHFYQATKGNKKFIKIGFSSSVGHTFFDNHFSDSLIKLDLDPVFTIAPSADLYELLKTKELDFVIASSQIKFPSLIAKKISSENLVLCSLSGSTNDTLLINSDMIHLEKIIYSIAYKNRWSIKDYFVIAKLLTDNNQLMGILPEGLLSQYPTLKVIKTYQNVGQITAYTWPGSIGIELIKKIRIKDNS